MARIDRSSAFQADVDEIWLCIARRHNVAADRVLAGIDAIVRLAADFPKIGTPVPHLGIGLRRLTSGPFLIFYRVDGDTLNLLPVLDGRRRITPLQFH